MKKNGYYELLFIKELPFILSQYLLSFPMFSISLSLKKELKNSVAWKTVDFYIQMAVYFLYSSDGFLSLLLEEHADVRGPGEVD